MEHFARRIHVFSVNEDSELPKPPSGMDVEPSQQGEHAEYIHRLEERWRFDAVDEADDEERRVLIDDFEARYGLQGDLTSDLMRFTYFLLKIPWRTSHRIF
jgi:hypothetical protein